MSYCKILLNSIYDIQKYFKDSGKSRKTHKKTTAHFERADNCAVEACGVVARNMSAIIILDAFLEKFGSDCKEDIDLAFQNYQKRINEI